MAEKQPPPAPLSTVKLYTFNIYKTNKYILLIKFNVPQKLSFLEIKFKLSFKELKGYLTPTTKNRCQHWKLQAWTFITLFLSNLHEYGIAVVNC